MDFYNRGAWSKSITRVSEFLIILKSREIALFFYEHFLVILVFGIKQGL